MICNIKDVYEYAGSRQKDALNALVLAQVVDSPGISRKEITHTNKLRPSSVSSACQDLLDRGILYEKSIVDPNQRGRPEVALYATTDYWTSACIFMESLDFRAALVDISGKITPLTIKNEYTTSTNYQDKLNAALSQVIEEKPEKGNFIGIGLSLPGFGIAQEHTWITSTRFGHLNQISSTHFGNSIDVHLNWVRSIDARMQSLLLSNPEFSKGKTILFHWGYGIGVTLSIDGKLTNDSFSKFGELGHTVVDHKSEKQCRCGSRGCLETEAAIWALLPSIKKRFDEVPVNEREFSAFLEKRFIEELPEIEKAIDYINIGLLNISKLFSPDRILLYGPFTDHDRIYNRVRENFYQNIPHSEFKSIDISRIQHTPADEVIGSTYSLFIDALRKDLTASS